MHALLRAATGGKVAGLRGGLPEAILFGKRDALLAKAHQQLRAEPGKYIPKVYGEHEVGGTSLLYVSDIPLDFLGYHGDPGQEPLPDLTWAALSKMPPVALGVMALMAGTYWIIERRMKLMGAKATLPKTAGQENENHG